MIEVERLNIKIIPDISNVLLKYNEYGTERNLKIIKFLLKMPKNKAHARIEKTLMEFNCRHRSVTTVFKNSFFKVEPLVRQISNEHFPLLTKLLIGSHFTMEYSLQASALFNPSIVMAPNQIDLPPGHIRVYISLRAIGEGHVSSLIFRQAIIDSKGSVSLLPTGEFVDQAKLIRNNKINKKNFIQKIKNIHILSDFTENLIKKLPDFLSYEQIRESIKTKGNFKNINAKTRLELETILWLAGSYIEINFSYDSDISERIIFPISKFEKNGIEDVRFTPFIDGNEKTYYGTYTAYDGRTILPKLIKTKDFVSFKTFPIHGKVAINKNLALFPRKINGKYAMLSRIDGVNIYLMYSDNILLWNEAQMIIQPLYSWERIQVGICAPPLEIDEGWLVVAHGVGPVREYCLSIVILDKNDPSKIIGRLKFPLMEPLESERNGYVPNVLYSCGAIIHEEFLIIPYAQSDFSSSFARINLNELIKITFNSK